jgi:DNA polymerase-3 subunit beta
LLELEPERFRAVATDGHRLALADVGAPEGLSEGKRVIAPRKGVQELMRLLERTSEPVQVDLGANHIRVELAGLRLTSKLIEGRFPDYNGVIPDADGPCLVAEREALRQALVRVSILSNEKYRGVRWVLEPDALRIHSNNPEQEEAEESVPVSYDGSAMEVGFNASYLLDAIGGLTDETVRVYLRDASSSALLMGEDDSSCRYVVMPMRL